MKDLIHFIEHYKTLFHLESAWEFQSSDNDFQSTLPFTLCLALSNQFHQSKTVTIAFFYLSTLNGSRSFTSPFLFIFVFTV